MSASSYIGLDDAAVLARAKAALLMLQSLPASSPARQAQWARFNSAMDELARRATNDAFRKIKKHEQESQD